MELDNKQTIIGNSGNYQLYAICSAAKLQLILMSDLNDDLFQLTLTNHTLPQSCKDIFLSFDEIFGEIKIHFTSNMHLISINDLGIITIYAKVINNQIRYIKNVQLQTHKVCNSEAVRNALLVVMIKEKKYLQPQYKDNKFRKIQCMISYDSEGPHHQYFNIQNDLLSYNLPSQKRVKIVIGRSFPPEGKYYISFKIETSQHNSIAIGIIDKTQALTFTKSPTSISYELATGEIKDTNYDKKGVETKWIQRGKAIQGDKGEGKGFIIRMEVDMDHQVIRWLCNGVVIGDGVVTNYLMGQQVVPYLNMRHVGDSVLLNSQ